MRDALVDRELHALGVDQDHAHLLGGRTHHDRGDHGVDEGGLTRTRLAGHQHVRGLGQVGDDVAALDILADADDERVLVAARSRGAQDVAEGHVLAVGVGDLDADGALAGNRREDTHVGRGHRIGDVLRQVGELVDLDAGAEHDLVAGHRRTAGEAGDPRVDVEVFKDLREGGDDLVVDGRARHVGRPGDEQVAGGQRVGDRVVQVGLECAIGFVGDRRGRGFVLGFGFVSRDVGGHLLVGQDGTHLGEHLGGRVRARGTRPWLGRRIGRGHGDRAGFEEAGLVHRFRLGRLAEGFVAVVFVKESVVSGGQVLAGLAASLLRRILLVSLGLAVLFVPPAQVGGEVTQTRGHVGHGRAGGQQDRVDQQQDEECAGAPGGDQEGQRAGDKPADEAARRVDSGFLPHAGVAARDVHEAGQGHRDADATGHVVRQGGATRPRGHQLASQGDEEQGQHDGEDAEESGGCVVDGVPGLAGNLEPFAQGDDDRCG